MKTITKQELLSWKPCYTPEQIDELWGKREIVTAQEIATAPIPAEDRLWVLIRMLPAREQRLFACDCAERALPIFERANPDDHRPREAIEVARRYAMGTATIDDLHAAKQAAAAAARVAARVAVWETARVAVWVAAWDTADATAWDVAWETARVAARVAAWDTVDATAWDAAQKAVWDAAQKAVWEAAQAAGQKWQIDRALWYLEQSEER